MRIGIDAYPLCREKITGLGVFLKNILMHISENDTVNEYFLYGNSEINIDIDNHRWHKVRITGPGFICKNSTVWFLTKCAFDLTKDCLDLFWGTQNFLPLFLSSK
jgi:hypothetical protein